MNKTNFNINKQLPESYDKLAIKTVVGYEQIYKMSLSLLYSNLGDDARVLIVGSGTGMELLTFAKGMPGWKLTGVEPSIENLDISRSKLIDAGLLNGIKLFCGYVDQLQNEKNFDAATLMFVLQLIPDDGKKLQLLKEIYKKILPGGSLIIADQFGDSKSPDFLNMLSGWKNYMLFEGTQPQLVEKIIERTLNSHYLNSESDLLELLSKAGFTNIQKFYSAFIYGAWVAERN